MLVGRRLQERASERTSERERDKERELVRDIPRKGRRKLREKEEQQASVSLSSILIEATTSKFLVDVTRSLKKLLGLVENESSMFLCSMLDKNRSENNRQYVQFILGNIATVALKLNQNSLFSYFFGNLSDQLTIPRPSN